jgi:hypothetical protein
LFHLKESSRDAGETSDGDVRIRGGHISSLRSVARLHIAGAGETGEGGGRAWETDEGGGGAWEAAAAACRCGIPPAAVIVLRERREIM